MAPLCAVCGKRGETFGVLDRSLNPCRISSTGAFFHRHGECRTMKRNSTDSLYNIDLSLSLSLLDTFSIPFWFISRCNSCVRLPLDRDGQAEKSDLGSRSLSPSRWRRISFSTRVGRELVERKQENARIDSCSSSLGGRGSLDTKMEDVECVMNDELNCVVFFPFAEMVDWPRAIKFWRLTDKCWKRPYRTRRPSGSCSGRAVSLTW